MPSGTGRGSATSLRRRAGHLPEAMTDDEFVSADQFQFEAPANMGIMTRARRSSIYGARGGSISSSSRTSQATSVASVASAPVGRTAIRGAGRKKETWSLTINADPQAKDSQAPTGRRSSRRLSSLPPLSFTTKKVSSAKKRPARALPKLAEEEQESKPKKRNSSEIQEDLFQDVEVVLHRLKKKDLPKTKMEANVVFEMLEEVKRSPKRVDIVCGKLLEEAHQTSDDDKEEEAVTPKPTAKVMPVRSSRRSAAKTRAGSTPLKPSLFNSPRVERALKPLQVHGTPQAANPLTQLKNNLKNRVQLQMKAKLATMPTSPYSLMEGETEDGSPAHVFTKLRAAAPTPSVAKLIVGDYNPRPATPAADCSIRANAGSPPKFAIDDLELDSDVEDNDVLGEKENESHSFAGSPLAATPMRKAPSQPQLMTGSLANACVIS